jgi:hypothetical protein
VENQKVAINFKPLNGRDFALSHWVIPRVGERVEFRDKEYVVDTVVYRYNAAEMYVIVYCR